MTGLPKTDDERKSVMAELYEKRDRHAKTAVHMLANGLTAFRTGENDMKAAEWFIGALGYHNSVEKIDADLAFLDRMTFAPPAALSKQGE